MKIDMEKFDIFRNNDLVKETYSVENLEKFNQMIGDEAISRLLVTTEHTNESVNLGHKAIWFKDAKAIAYNILNFWREPGHSGEMPFLNIHTNSQYTLGAKYIMSLTEEQLKAAENLNIPGLIDIINQVKNNPKKFTQNQINQGEKWVTNPAYNKIEQGLGKMCGHFLENGTEDENYFSVSTATKLGFMRYKKNNSKLRNNLIDTLSERIGLDENVKANFKKHYKIFIDKA